MPRTERTTRQMLRHIPIHHLVLRVRVPRQPSRPFRLIAPHIHRSKPSQLRLQPVPTPHRPTSHLPPLGRRGGGTFPALSRPGIHRGNPRRRRRRIIEEETHALLARPIMGQRRRVHSPRLAGQVARLAADGDVDLEELLRLGAGAALHAVRLPEVGRVERGGAPSQLSDRGRVRGVGGFAGAVADHGGEVEGAFSMGGFELAGEETFTGLVGA
jgi:hypothetical protein